MNEEGKGPRLPALGAGREFDRIRKILAGGVEAGVSDSLPMGGVLVGPGDDGAILDGGIVLSTDLSIEGVHFRLDWISPEEAGYRGAAAGVSDLAAMAAEPLGVLASVAAPGDGEQAEFLMSGVRRFCLAQGIPLLGGDLTRSPGPLLLDIVSIGRSTSPLLRQGARAGDELWVTGVLGGAAGAVALWEAGGTPPTELRQAFAAPAPRLREARFLVEAGARGGMDLSDGIAGDAAHLAAASGVAAILETGAFPLHPGLLRTALPEGATPIDLALYGGEDYELLLAAPPGVLGGRVEEFRRRFDLSLTRVGRFAAGSGVLLDSGGPDDLSRPRRGGYDHFTTDSEEDGKA